MEAANQTAKNLIMSTPVLSYTIVGVAKLTGDDQTASDLFHQANGYLANTVDATPLIGHVKGLVHFVQGDVAKGHDSMASATRSTSVLLAGAGGFFIGGVVGAFVLGTQAGIIWDAGVCIATKGKKKSGLARIDPRDPWTCVDAFVGVIGDGMAGLSVQGGVTLTQLETAETYLENQGDDCLTATKEQKQKGRNKSKEI